MNAGCTEFFLQGFYLQIFYIDTEAAAREGSGAEVGAGLASAGAVTVSGCFTNRCGRPPASLMRAATPMTIMLLRTSVSTRLLAAITTLLPILASPTSLAPGPK